MGARVDPTPTPVAYCDGCGTCTGIMEHRPPRLCEECQHEAIWAVPGELVRNTKSGETAVVTGVGGGLPRRHPDGSTVEWPLDDCERIERRWYAGRL
jgi:hypothetical protein